ncbi:MAG: SpoIIE family protein phosphatase [Bacteroidia bacterium]|nr:SpoIIE family protein phosphatase [Bacteroidia bacterium]
MLFFRQFLFLYCLLSFLAEEVKGQTGNYFVRNYLPKEYQESGNNSGITQNNEGLIFIANNNGVLVFDGINWDQCKREDEVSIFCIAKTSEGEIVVGTADGDIAKIVKNHKGKYTYVSLLDNIPEDERPKEIIRQIITIGSNTYFLAADKLVEYAKAKVMVFEPKNVLHNRAFSLGKHLYVLDVGSSISLFDKGKFIPVPGTESLSEEKLFYAYSLSPTQTALGFRNIGTVLVQYDSLNPLNLKFESKSVESDQEIIAAEANNGQLLKNGNFIVTTNKKGAFELDTNLNIVGRFNSKKGIFDDNIKSAFQDLNGNLWLALYYGIGFVEINSRLFHYTRDNGIAGPVQSACYFNNRLYIATDKGVQYYDSLLDKFQFLETLDKQAWFLLPLNGQLLIGTAKGLLVYSNGGIKSLNESNTFCLYQSQDTKKTLYTGTDYGVEIYKQGPSGFQNYQTLELGSGVKTIAEDQEGNVFFATEDRGIFYLNSGTPERLDSIQGKEGPTPEWEQQWDLENSVFSYKGLVYVGSELGIFLLSKDSKNRFRCSINTKLWLKTKGGQVFRAAQAGNDLVYSYKEFLSKKNKNREKIILLERNADRFQVNNAAMNRLLDLNANFISYDSIKKDVFICGEGLFILRNVKINQNKHYNLILKKFVSNKDTLLMNVSAIDSLATEKLKIPYENHDVSVVLGFTSFESGSYEFSYKLEGFNSEFSEWNKDPLLSFGNLLEGNYVLIVRARTDLENKIHEIKIPFRILPPWYRSKLAYALYLLLLVFLVVLIVKLNSRRLTAANKKLEETIAERTKTISHQKEEIEDKQKEILDSIIYARRIQRALLASDQLLKENLKDYFVFFQPKDVVSGDFYWASLLPNKQFALITADSTGHGVPGAIMSMLNISCLKEAVESEKLITPKDILNHARKKVIDTLANDGSQEGGKDGMDCSLACFDFKAPALHYAAANNPIWIARKNETQDQDPVELIELPCDKMPVGKHDRDTVSFQQNTFELKSGDMVYTLTDGFADQFGGPKGKKFMYKKLKDLLIAISQLSSEEQFNKVKQAFEEWKGELEQVDDVSLIGIRIH